MSANWTCVVCSTVNAPHEGACIGCASLRPAVVPTVDRTRVMPSASAPPSFGHPPVSPNDPGYAAVSGHHAPGGAGPHTTFGAPAPSGGGAKGILVGAAAAVVAILLGVGAFILVSNGSSDDAAADRTDTESGEEGRRAPEPSAPATTPPPDEIGEAEQVPTTEPTPAERTTYLWADVAKLRTSPSLGATVERSIERMRGTPVTVHGDLVGGWYEVTIDGSRGYIYAGLLEPIEAGYCVIWDRSVPRHWGSERILVREVVDEFMATVVLPDGTTGYWEVYGIGYEDQVGCW